MFCISYNILLLSDVCTIEKNKNKTKQKKKKKNCVAVEKIKK